LPKKPIIHCLFQKFSLLGGASKTDYLVRLLNFETDDVQSNNQNWDSHL